MAVAVSVTIVWSTQSIASLAMWLIALRHHRLYIKMDGSFRYEDKMSQVQTLPSFSEDVIWHKRRLAQSLVLSQLSIMTKNWHLNIHWCDKNSIYRNHSWEKCNWCVLWVFSLLQVPSAKMEETYFMTCTAATIGGWSRRFGFTSGEPSRCPSLWTVCGPTQHTSVNDIGNDIVPSQRYNPGFSLHAR